jgi:hypothetical protein
MAAAGGVADHLPAVPGGRADQREAGPMESGVVVASTADRLPYLRRERNDMSYTPLRPDVVSSYRNSENERVTIQRVRRGKFEGRYLLCIHDDDDQGGTVAPTLLDEGLRQFLLGELDKLGGPFLLPGYQIENTHGITIEDDR